MYIHAIVAEGHIALGDWWGIDLGGRAQSMPRKGNCYDNAPTESLWGSLKNELVHHERYETRLQAEASIREYIEIFYNRRRRHSAIGNLSPATFLKNYYLQLGSL